MAQLAMLQNCLRVLGKHTRLFKVLTLPSRLYSFCRLLLWVNVWSLSATQHPVKKSVFSKVPLNKASLSWIFMNPRENNNVFKVKQMYGHTWINSLSGNESAPIRAAPRILL